MVGSQPSETTILLRRWAAGDRTALDNLTPRVYKELRKVAARLMKNERPGRTIEPTALVHEAYIRLVNVDQVDWQHRAHFFAIAAQVMRHILVDHARKRSTTKRDAEFAPVDVELIPDGSHCRDADLLSIDAALDSLAGLDPRKARVVELRFFGGLTVDETAAVLHVSPDTVHRDWKMARSWLLAQLSGA